MVRRQLQRQQAKSHRLPGQARSSEKATKFKHNETETSDADVAGPGRRWQRGDLQGPCQACPRPRPEARGPRPVLQTATSAGGHRGSSGGR